MSRPAALRWDAQRNKWKVVYQGKKYRFDGGDGKSDREAKRRADVDWKTLKAQLDYQTERAKPHRVEYEKVIEEWSSVLAWSLEHDDHKYVAVARDKIASLERRLNQPVPPPLDWADRFLAGPPPDYELNERMAPVYEAAGLTPIITMTGGYPGTERQIWDDRLHARTLRIHAVGADNTLAANVRAFVDRKRSEAEAGQLEAGRVESIRLYLEKFLQYLGRTTPVQSINHTIVAGFRDHLVERIRAEQLKPSYARDIFSAFKQFVRWLANHTDKLEHIPKNLDDRSLAISVGPSEVITIDKTAIHELLKKATDRTQLYILLSLNTAMTQQDMSDLRDREVEWTHGRITRKRSKTSDCKNVPTVSYPLWPETFRLLQEQRAREGDRVLLNEAGGLLKLESFDNDDDFDKKDAVRSAIRRLSKKTAITFTVKTLKKTSATLLQGNAKYRGLESLFLGHAPATVAERHYTSVPQELFNEAITWLGQELGLSGRLADLPDAPAKESAPVTSKAIISAPQNSEKAGRRKRKTNRDSTPPTAT